MCTVYNVHTYIYVYIDDLIGEKEKSRLLTEEMEATLQDIQNMY